MTQFLSHFDSEKILSVYICICIFNKFNLKVLITQNFFTVGVNANLREIFLLPGIIITLLYYCLTLLSRVVRLLLPM